MKRISRVYKYKFAALVRAPQCAKLTGAERTRLRAAGGCATDLPHKRGWGELVSSV